MRLYLYTRSEERMKLVEGDDLARLEDVLEIGDGELLWPDDESDAPLPHATTFGQLGHGQRLFCGSCQRVIAVVRYNGETVSKEFRPGAPMRRILRWALTEREFAISDPSPADFELRMCSADIVPDPDDLVGAFVGDDCEVCFDLTPADKFQGAPDGPH